MSIADAQTIRNDYRMSIICLDSYEGKQMCGKLYNTFYSEGMQFRSLTELLCLLEGLADTISYPMASTEHRRFKPKDKPYTETNESCCVKYKTGIIGTFGIKIMFRQNASWQGIIHWIEEDIQEYFRSALEMILLIDSALDTESTKGYKG